MEEGKNGLNYPGEGEKSRKHPPVGVVEKYIRRSQAGATVTDVAAAIACLAVTVATAFPRDMVPNSLPSTSGVCYAYVTGSEVDKPSEIIVSTFFIIVTYLSLSFNS